MKITKTIKLFINGEFPRSESGRIFETAGGNLPLASKKDVRIAVEAARGAQKGWAKKTAFNRSQILYRMAEMMEGKRDEFVALGLSSDAVTPAIDAFVYYAGFCDKYQQTIGAVNPVSGPFHNFTTPDAMGVIGLICADTLNLEKLVADISGIIAGGNSVVALLGHDKPEILGPLSEVFATSDLPGGVVNLLTGERSELLETLASHMEVDAISYQHSDASEVKKLQELGAENMKRIVLRTNMKTPLSIEPILNFVEYKTVWHPIGV